MMAVSHRGLSGFLDSTYKGTNKTLYATLCYVRDPRLQKKPKGGVTVGRTPIHRGTAGLVWHRQDAPGQMRGADVR